MKKIVIFGAGRSSSLIEYLLSIAEEQNLLITLLDYNEELAKSKINNHKFGEAHFIDANNLNKDSNSLRNLNWSYLCYCTYAFGYC